MNTAQPINHHYFSFMKRFVFLFAFFFVGISLTASAQRREDRQEKIQALYVAYITQQLNLTETEAQKFWPVHKEYDTEIRAVDPKLPELQRQQAILDIKKKYQPNFTRILGENRTDDFFKKDMEFRKQLVNQLRKSRQERSNNQLRNRQNRN